MKILWIPLLYVSIPWIIAILQYKFVSKSWFQNQSIIGKAVLIFIFILLSILLTLQGFVTSIEGMSAKGIKSMTGAIIFLPIGFGAIAWYIFTLFSKPKMTIK